MQDYVNYQLRYKYWRQWNKKRWPMGIKKKPYTSYMENLPKAAKTSSNQSFSRTSPAKCPNNPAEHGSLFIFFQKINPASFALWDWGIEPVAPAAPPSQTPSAVGSAAGSFSPPRLKVYTQFSQTGCDAARWTSRPGFTLLFCRLREYSGREFSKKKKKKRSSVKIWLETPTN